MLNTGLLLSDT